MTQTHRPGPDETITGASTPGGATIVGSSYRAKSDGPGHWLARPNGTESG